MLEPSFPAAVDRYVDLGRYYDLQAAKEDREEILRCTAAYKEAYRRAYRALHAARSMEEDALESVTVDRARLERRFRGIRTREVRQRGPERGRTLRRFLGSLTWKGPVWRFDSVEALCPRVYALEDSYGLAGPCLEEMRRAASERGWDTVACCAPEDPDRLEHLLIPGLGLGFVTTRRGMEYPGSPCRRIRVDALAEVRDRNRLRFARKMAEELREEAVRALGEAKAHHDALEAVYNPYVDFDGVRALAALEAGRLLSWLREERTGCPKAERQP